MINIVIPLGGFGQRFRDAGYVYPKPLIKVFGKEILFWLMDSFNLDTIDNVIIPYNKELSKYNFEDIVRQRYSKLKIIFYQLPVQTNGAVDTLKILLQTNSHLLDNIYPVMCIDGDNFYKCDIISMLSSSSSKNALFYHVNTQSNPIYSYISIDDDGYVTKIKEKEKLSDNACTGIYCFESFSFLHRSIKSFLSRPLDTLNHGELYTSKLIDFLLPANKFLSICVQSSDYICLGTPLQLRCYYNNIPVHSAIPTVNSIKLDVNNIRVCFDLDNTLVTTPLIANDYTTVMPIRNMINYLCYLKKMGITIIIYTARRMLTHSGNQGKVLADIGTITFDTLKKFNIPFDEIYFGKPYADFYIDDKAVNPFGDYEKEMGFYLNNIHPRSFNNLTLDVSEGVQFYRKSGRVDGEIYYYNNIPPTIKDIFPIMISYNENNQWYSIERIEGITISELYMSQELTDSVLYYIMSTLNRIHSSVTKVIDIDIYKNYNYKLKQRFLPENYMNLSDAQEIYVVLSKYLIDYEKNNRGIPCVIHGDPVFSNIMINVYGKIKMIDMRGKLGDQYSIFGDGLYDYAKIYQSLCGYDEVLNNKILSSYYKQRLRTWFETFIVNKFNKQTLDDIKIITKSLIFSLIPLHEEKNRKDLFELINVV